VVPALTGESAAAGLHGQDTEVFNCASILIDAFLDRLELLPRRLFGATAEVDLDVIRAAGMMAMEIISNSDALYHDIEHSMMVTLVGQDILHGKLLRDGGVTPGEWTHYIISLLCHDIGYCRGICHGDQGASQVIDDAGGTIEMPPGATDAFLTPYHVERGKMFVRRRFRNHPMIDAEIIAANIEHTRFPVPEGSDNLQGTDYPQLVAAADLIGQMADPDYLRKLPALFYEFEETGANQRLGNTTPEDLREKYPDFFWGMVNKEVTAGLDYLRVTRSGRQWLASLYSHIVSA
jgi:hypothetical protein